MPLDVVGKTDNPAVVKHPGFIKIVVKKLDCIAYWFYWHKYADYA